MPQKPTYKPLLYTTTVRNPERYKDFMHILKKYDGQVLTNGLIKRCECELFRVGLYRPVRQPDSVRRKWTGTARGDFTIEALTDGEAEAVYDLNDPQLHADIKGHKEAGFDKGWPSRFDTQFKLMKTLGFVYYAMGEPIRFSATGTALAESVRIETDGIVTREVVKPQNEQMAFMQAFAKQQRCNPFIRELNDNIPLILLLQVIRLLNADEAYNNCGISYKEIPLLIFWKDNDAVALYHLIKSIRSKCGYSPSDEAIADICTNKILDGFKQFKMKSVVSEYPDEFVRKMRMTGLISFRGGGRFIDINHNEDNRVDYIISTYSNYKKYDDERQYFDYMAATDHNLFNLQSSPAAKTAASEKLPSWLEVYSWDNIKAELRTLGRRQASKDSVLKFIPAPSRLEFLTALAIKSRLPDVSVVPNYPCDDEGLPTSTAGGNTADIECCEITRAYTANAKKSQVNANK